jgi:outer membrane protein assembly factor BamD (BamD/ComL family)
MRMHPLPQIAVLLILAFLGGCAAPLASSRDSGLAVSGSTESTSLFDTDRLSKQMKNAARTAVGKGTNPDKARELYAEAERQYRAAIEAGDRRSDYLAAAKGFRAAAERWPDSALEQDALFLAGESYFFADYYPKANESFEMLLKKFPHTKYMDLVEARRFAIADYWLKLNEIESQAFWEFNFFDNRRPMRDAFGHAVRVFDRIRIDDPTGRLADDATLAAGNAYFASGRYLEADNFYTDLRKTFPSSEHQFRAHLLGVQAKLRSYQGTDYSGIPLDEAEKLIKQIRRQFPHEAEKERDFLTRAYAEVRFNKAQREWNMARYYDRRGESGAARFHYAVVANDYAETPFSRRAADRLVELGDAPDVPPQPLVWLVEMFPKEEDLRPLMANQQPETTLR